jgi:hypothetical protein
MSVHHVHQTSDGVVIDLEAAPSTPVSIDEDAKAVAKPVGELNRSVSRNKIIANSNSNSIGSNDETSVRIMPSKPREASLKQQRELVFQKLLRVDAKRMEISNYTQKSGFEILFKFAGTVWLNVLFQPLLYVTLAVYFVSRWKHFDDYVLPSTGAMGVLGALMSFLIVFFVQQSYTRYFAQQQTCVGCQTRLMDAVALSKGFISEEHQWKMWRYLNAAHILGYVGISDVYNMDNLLENLNEKCALLTHDELIAIHAIGGDNGIKASNMLITWACDVAFTLRDMKLVPDLYIFNVMISINALKTNIAVLFSYNSVPVPFNYVHAVYFIQYIYLPLFAYACANSMNLLEKGTSHELIGPVAVFLNCLFVIGLTGVLL